MLDAESEGKLSGEGALVLPGERAKNTMKLHAG